MAIFGLCSAEAEIENQTSNNSIQLTSPRRFTAWRAADFCVRCVKITKGEEEYEEAKLEIQSFTLPFTTCDIECFDVELKEGQKATFFLQSVERGIATLSFPGGVAIFPEEYFY